MTEETTLLYEISKYHNLKFEIWLKLLCRSINIESKLSTTKLLTKNVTDWIKTDEYKHIFDSVLKLKWFIIYKNIFDFTEPTQRSSIVDLLLDGLLTNFTNDRVDILNHLLKYSNVSYTSLFIDYVNIESSDDLFTYLLQDFVIYKTDIKNILNIAINHNYKLYYTQLSHKTLNIWAISKESVILLWMRGEFDILYRFISNCRKDPSEDILHVIYDGVNRADHLSLIYLIVGKMKTKTITQIVIYDVYTCLKLIYSLLNIVWTILSTMYFYINKLVGF